MKIVDFGDRREGNDRDVPYMQNGDYVCRAMPEIWPEYSREALLFLPAFQ